MNQPNDVTLARMQADWPRWELWIVRRVVGGPVWCARRHDNHRLVLNADSPEHLAEALEDAASE